jgi:hypothetical protein
MYFSDQIESKQDYYGLRDEGLPQNLIQKTKNFATLSQYILSLLIFGVNKRE